jgi:RNA polymerase sigma-70 factor (ECF subfamily)
LPEIDESELVIRLRAGEASAWTVFVDTFSPRVWRYVARLVGSDRHVVADLVQEVLLAAVRGIGQFDSCRGSLVCWLLGISHRQCALYWRRQTATSRQSVLYSDSLFVISEGSDAEANLHTTELTAAVRHLLTLLPEETANILIGRYLDGRSTAELAIDFAVSEEAIRARLVRARERFREQFALAFQDFVP